MHLRRLSHAAAAVGALLPAAAWPQLGEIGIAYEPVAAVPTLSQAALILMAILLAALAFRMLRHTHQSAGRSIGLVLALGALVLGAGGIRGLGEAHAVNGYVEMTEPSGGTVFADYAGQEVRNATGRTQQVVKIFCQDHQSGPEGQLSVVNNGGPMCSDDPPTVLAADESCYAPDICFAGNVGNFGSQPAPP